MKKNEAWFFSQHEEAERWQGPFPTKAKAIAAGRVVHDSAFYIGLGFQPDAASFVRVDADGLLEAMGENASEDHAEASDGWPKKATKAAAKELSRFLADWARKHAPVTFWELHGPTTRIPAVDEFE